MPQRLISYPLNDYAEHRADRHRNQNTDYRRQSHTADCGKYHKGSDHNNVSVREIQHLRNAVHHGVSQGDNRVYASQADSIHQVGYESYHT